MLEIYLMNISDNLTDYQFNRLLSYVLEDKKEKILRFRRKEDRQRSLLGNLFVKYWISQSISLDIRDIKFVHNKYGKPFLEDMDNLYFNLSHAGNKIACAIDSREVGIDVERVKDIDLDIGKRFFTPNEYELIKLQNESNQLDFFYNIWTLKEAYVKAKGKGLSIPLDSFEFEYNDGKFQLSGENKVYNCFQYKIHDYIMSICSKSNKVDRYVYMEMNQWIEKIIGKS